MAKNHQPLNSSGSSWALAHRHATMWTARRAMAASHSCIRGSLMLVGSFLLSTNDQPVFERVAVSCATTGFRTGSSNHTAISSIIVASRRWPLVLLASGQIASVVALVRPTTFVEKFLY
jgi:hypothetical protein